MRIAYSTVMSEILGAEYADYGDCAKYQIVCPSCREAVFKGKRESDGKSPTHYFSHYHATDEEARACEMRVAAMARLYEAPPFVGSHGQTLRQFLERLQTAIISAQADIVPPGTLRRTITSIMSQADQQFWVTPVRRMVIPDASIIGAKGLNSDRNKTVESISGVTAFSNRSPFWQRRQASYVLDVASHLATSQAAASVTFIAAACYAMLIHAPQVYRNDELDENFSNVLHAAKILASGDRRASKTILSGWPKNAFHRSIDREKKTAYERGLQAGGEVVKQSTSAFNGILEPGIQTWDWKPQPTKTSDLLSRVVESTLQKDPVGVARRDLAEAEAEAGRAREAQNIAAENLAKLNYELISLAISITLWPIFVGLLASVPYNELAPPRDVIPAAPGTHQPSD